MGKQVSIEKRLAIYVRDNYKCYICHKEVTTGVDATLDHIKPRGKSGNNSYSNLKTCCLKCNVKKSNKDYRLFIIQKIDSHRVDKICNDFFSSMSD